jgi:Rod binding domain-containing protein
VANRIQDAKGAANALESYFLRRVLSEVKTSEEGLLGGGFAGGMFKEMFDEAIADSMSAAGGIGIGQTVAKQLDPAAAVKSKHAAAPEPVAPKAAPETHSIRPHGVALHPTSSLRPETADTRPDAPTVRPDTPIVRPDTAPIQPGSVTIRRAYQSAQEPPSSLPNRGRTTDGR